MPSLAGAALWYVNRGLLVFPLKPRTKVPATKRGFHDASLSPDTIRAWWTREPQANIGLVTGHLFDVIDIDGDLGDASLITAPAELFPPDIGLVKTPRGWHYYIPPTGDGCATAIMPGIDYRGIGGYVVAPPSINEHGKAYTWATPITLTT
jgi:hypothetical protein